MNRIKKVLIILLTVTLILVTACTNNTEDPSSLESYEEMRDTYEDLGTFNHEILLLVEDFFTTITKIENDEDNIEEYMEDNLERLDQAGRSHLSYMEKIIEKAEEGIWDNRDMADMVVILDNIETTLDVLDESYINAKEYNETRDKEASNLHIVMMDVGVIQDSLLDNSQKVEENMEGLYYRIQNY